MCTYASPVWYNSRGVIHMPYNEASYKAAQKYRASKIKRVPLDMQISDYDKVKTHAEAHSESVNGFINRAISEAMERDGAAPGGAEGPGEAKKEDLTTTDFVPDYTFENIEELFKEYKRSREI